MTPHGEIELRNGTMETELGIPWHREHGIFQGLEAAWEQIYLDFNEVNGTKIFATNISVSSITRQSSIGSNPWEVVVTGMNCDPSELYDYDRSDRICWSIDPQKVQQLGYNRVLYPTITVWPVDSVRFKHWLTQREYPIQHQKDLRLQCSPNTYYVMDEQHRFTLRGVEVNALSRRLPYSRVK